MSNLNIEFLGLRELQKEMEERFGVEFHEPVLEKGANYFKEQLEQSVYDYGLKKRTGKSENSMVIETKKGADEVYVGVSNQDNDAFYLYFHEWGTSRMRARPFMRPTFENQLQNIIDAMKEEMKARLRL